MVPMLWLRQTSVHHAIKGRTLEKIGYWYLVGSRRDEHLEPVPSANRREQYYSSDDYYYHVLVLLLRPPVAHATPLPYGTNPPRQPWKPDCWVGVLKPWFWRVLPSSEPFSFFPLLSCGCYLSCASFMFDIHPLASLRLWTWGWGWGLGEKEPEKSYGAGEKV